MKKSVPVAFQSVIFAVLIMLLQSCERYYTFHYPITKLYGGEKQFVIDLDVNNYKGDGEITMMFLSKKSPSNLVKAFIKDTISTVRFISDTLYFDNGIFLEKKTRYNSQWKYNEKYYTCDKFTKQIKTNKYLNIKVVYDLDSAGLVTHHEKIYKYARQNNYRSAIRFH